MFEDKSENLIQTLKKKMRKVELLPTRECEAGYGPGFMGDFFSKKRII